MNSFSMEENPSNHQPKQSLTTGSLSLEDRPISPMLPRENLHEQRRQAPFRERSASSLRRCCGTAGSAHLGWAKLFNHLPALAAAPGTSPVSPTRQVASWTDTAPKCQNPRLPCNCHACHALFPINAWDRSGSMQPRRMHDVVA